MLKSLPTASVMILFLTLACADAQAHKPVVINGGPTDYLTAHEVPDPEVSYVGYHERTSEAPELWFTFEVQQGTPCASPVTLTEID